VGYRFRRAPPSCGRNTYRTKERNYHFGTWNVRTLLDTADSDRPARRTALVAAELKSYNIDIAALNATRLADEGSLSEVGEGYTFFWKDLPSDERRIHSVGFAIWTTLPNKLPETPIAVSERLMTLRIPLAKNRYMTVLSAYAPTLPLDESSKDRFYDTLRTSLPSIPCQDKIVHSQEQCVVQNVGLIIALSERPSGSRSDHLFAKRSLNGAWMSRLYRTQTNSQLSVSRSI